MVIDAKELFWIDRRRHGWSPSWVIYMTEPYSKIRKRLITWKRGLNGSCCMKGPSTKKAFSHPLLRCTTPEEGKRILAEIHERDYGSHIRGEGWPQRHWEGVTTGLYFSDKCHLPPTPPSIHPFDDNTFPIIFHKVGNWHSKSFPKVNGTTQVSICCSGLFDLVGRSRGDGIHYQEGGL